MSSTQKETSPTQPIIPDDVRKVYERTTDGVVILDAEWVCVYLNAPAGRLWRRSPAELIGKNLWEVYPEAVDQPFYQTCHQARDEQRVIHLEEQYAPWDCWFDVHIHPSADGSITLFFRDVSERKRSEVALAAERSLLRSIIDMMPDAVYAKDGEHRFTLANQPLADLLGVASPDDVLGKTDFDFYPGEAAARFAATERRILQTGEIAQRNEIIDAAPFDSERETVRWLRAFKGPLRDTSGAIAGVIGIARNIADRRLVEDALHTSRARYRHLFELSPIPLLEEDISALRRRLVALRGAGISDLREYLGVHPEVVSECLALIRIVAANQATLDLYEVTDLQQLADFFVRLVEPDIQHQAQTSFISIADGKSHFTYDVVNYSATGKRLELELHWVVLPGSEESFERVLVALVDITGRNEQAAALRASEERYRLLFEEAPLSLWEEDYTEIKRRLERLRADGVDDLHRYLSSHPEEIAACLSDLRVLDVNETSVRMYGAADKNDLIQNLARIIPAEQRSGLITSYVSVIEGETHFEQEVVDNTLAGEKLSLVMRWSRLPTTHKDEIRVLVALVDITERKKLEEESRRQALLLDQISDAMISTDEKFVIRSWNRGAERIYGWQTAEAVGRDFAEILATRFLSGDLQDAINTLWAVGHWEGEVEQTRKDGSTLPILSSVTLIRDKSGQTIGTVGVNRDMTKLRQAERSLSLAEERYRHLFDEAPMMYLTLEDRDGQPIVTDANRFYLETLGYRREDVIGCNGMDFLAADSRQKALGAYPQIVGGVSLVAERSLMTRNGRRIDTLIRAIPEFSTAGQVTGILAMYTDITPLKEAENHALREAERVRTLLHLASRLNRHLALQPMMQAICQEIALLLDVPGVSLSLVDRQTNCFVHAADTGLPPGYERLTKSIPVPPNLTGTLDALELVRINPIATLSASPNYAIYVEQGLQTGVNVILTRDGALVGSINLHITDPQRHFSRDDVALLRGIADVTTQAILNAQLLEEVHRHAEELEGLVAERTADLEIALYQAQEADRIKSQFVSDINHELRTPLTNITLYLDLLTRGRPEKREQAIAVMQRETARLRHLVEEVLDLSRLDLGKIDIHPRPVLLNSIIQELLEDRDVLLARSSLAFSFQPWEGLSPISVDAGLVVRILTNFLDNAFNYTVQGGIRIETSRQWAEGRQWQTVSVTDTGPGIDPEDLPHLFERFYRGQSARQSGASGTGLGLAICYEIATRHKGHISVDTEYGKGSTFTLWLPANEG